MWTRIRTIASYAFCRISLVRRRVSRFVAVFIDSGGLVWFNIILGQRQLNARKSCQASIVPRGLISLFLIHIAGHA